MKIVVALGGNALGDTPLKQREITKKTAKCIVPIIKEGHKLIITHGNGPQIGLINLAFDEGNKANSKVSTMPFTECGAMSQGYIGFHLQNAIQNELDKEGINKKVSTVVTRIEVDKNDPAFINPTKPIGSYYSKEEIEKMNVDYVLIPNKGYRRVVPSPLPKNILEEEIIKSLYLNGNIVISCGGGGIPVINNNGEYIGIDAVIDKDYASGKLADNLDSDCLLILTNVENASLNYGKENEELITNISFEKMSSYYNEGYFPAGSMGPKVKACLDFVSKGQNRVAIITNIENAVNAINGKCGTRITK